MKVLFIVPYPPQGASNRFRVLQFLPFLHQEGIRTRVRPFYSPALWRILYQPGCYTRKFIYGIICSLNRVLDLLRSISYDIVFIHRESFPIGPAWFEWLLRLFGKPYVYDFDDAIFLPNVAAPNRALGKLKCPGKVVSIVRGSRATIAGNCYPADYNLVLFLHPVTREPERLRFCPRWWIPISLSRETGWRKRTRL